MDAFLRVHDAAVTGTLATFDRMVFKGHLTNLYKPGNFARYLWVAGSAAARLRQVCAGSDRYSQTTRRALGRESGTPVSLPRADGYQAVRPIKARSGKAIAARDGVKEGLVCVLSAVEPCRAFSVQGNHRTKRLEVVLRSRKCLHFYFYILDPQFGLLHVRLQSWFPFTIQIYLNGRAWLARQLERKGIEYEMYENCFTSIARLDVAQQLAERLAHRRWPRVLDAFPRKVTPWLPTRRAAGFGGYYWVLDQSEFATDVMFKNRAALHRSCPS
jgi:hypothetical protein